MNPSHGVGASRSLLHASTAPLLAQRCSPGRCYTSILPEIGKNYCRPLKFFIRSRSRLWPAPAKPRKVEHEFSEDDEYERDSSLEDGDSMLLLVQLVRTILRKMSLRATKAARRMLPPIFTLDLISFFVNGALWLTLFWVAKALLEVVCSMGSMMFIGLLLVRILWSVLAYLQSQSYSDGSGNSRSSNRRGGGSGGGGFDDYEYGSSPT